MKKWHKQAIDLAEQGLSWRKVAKELGMSKSTVSDFLREWYKKDGKEEWKADDKDLDVMCNSSDWDVANLAKRLRAAQRSNNQLRKIQREVFDDPSVELHDMMESLVENLRGAFYEHKKVFRSQDYQKPRTVEILFSDLQIGKISENWDTEIAKKALRYYGEQVLQIVEETKPERIVFASLGDICECHLKHGTQSAIATDTSNAEQMANAITLIWWEVLAPLISLDIPMEIVGVQGNHLSSEGKGMDMFKAGRYGYDFVIYSAWMNMVKLIKAEHVTFNVPEGHFATYDIYGKLTVAEHGYTCKGSSEKALMDLREKRMNNLQQYVNRVVVGDMHHYCNYDNGNLQVNGAFFGVAFDAVEYSGILGYHAVPAQIVNIHEPIQGVGQTTVVETKVIQVAKGY